MAGVSICNSWDMLGLHIIHGWHTHDSCKKKRRIKTSTEILEVKGMDAAIGVLTN